MQLKDAGLAAPGCSELATSMALPAHLPACPAAAGAQWPVGWTWRWTAAAAQLSGAGPQRAPSRSISAAASVRALLGVQRAAGSRPGAHPQPTALAPLRLSKARAHSLGLPHRGHRKKGGQLRLVSRGSGPVLMSLKWGFFCGFAPLPDNQDPCAVGCRLPPVQQSSSSASVGAARPPAAALRWRLEHLELTACLQAALHHVLKPGLDVSARGQRSPEQVLSLPPPGTTLGRGHRFTTYFRAAGYRACPYKKALHAILCVCFL